jgi:hypothetical protein
VVTRSDEHVWGALRHDVRELPAGRLSHVAGFATSPTSPSGSSFIEVPTVTTTNKASAFNIITREVCKECNTGWMSRLVDRSKPLILALAEPGGAETAVERERDQQRTLAIWAQKTALTNDLAGPTPVRVARFEMGRQLRDGSPVRGSAVWAGRNERDFWPGTALASIGAGPHPVPGEQHRHGKAPGSRSRTGTS